MSRSWRSGGGTEQDQDHGDTGHHAGLPRTTGTRRNRISRQTDSAGPYQSSSPRRPPTGRGTSHVDVGADLVAKGQPRRPAWSSCKNAKAPWF
jgi:hypothetical protein